jgi:hypothetical protein
MFSYAGLLMTGSLFQPPHKDGNAMPSLGVNIQGQLNREYRSAARPKPRIVSQEPFSPVAAFLLGLISGLGVAFGVFVILFR